jgi:hypothetical protein
MAYAFSASAAGTAGSDTVTVSGAGFTAGDYVTLWLRVNGTSNSISASPSGFSLIATVDEVLANIGQPQQLFVYGAPYVSGNFSFTIGGANGTTPTLIAVSNSGRVSTAPTNFQSTVSNGSGSPVSEPFTGITAAANDDILWGGCIAAGSAAGTWVTTAPAGYTRRQEVSQNGGIGYAGTSAVCSLDAASAGATGTLTGSAANAGNSGDRYGLVLALSATASGSFPPVPGIPLIDQRNNPLLRM